MKAKEHYGFDGKYKIYQICSNRKAEIEMRPFVGYCIFIDGYVYATNAYMVARAAITKISNLSKEDINKLQNKAIRGDLFRKMLSYEIKAITDTAIECVGEQDYTVLFGLVNILRGYKNASIKPPHKNEIYIPTLDEFFTKNYSTTNSYPCDKIGINADYLGRIASAIGAEKVGLFFNEKKNGAISIRGLADDFNPVQGLLMPCLIN